MAGSRVLLRRALVVATLGICANSSVTAEEIVAARYDTPTTRYAHGILGDAVEWGALVITTDTCPKCTSSVKHTTTITLPLDHVFEDIEPRLADVDNDGDVEIIVIETDMRLGGSLAIYDDTGKIAETPHIGRTHRWLAPVGAADLDGDGAVELAYIDRPHLAKELHIWRFDNGALIPVATRSGLTNHRIGEAYISGGIRHCAGAPEMITVNANWTRLMASTLSGNKIKSRDIGPHNGRDSFATAMVCG